MGKLIFQESNEELKWHFFDEQETLISTYSFMSKKNNGSDIGKKIIKCTMCRFAIMDILNVSSLTVSSYLSPEEIEYLNYELDRFKKHSKEYYEMDIPLQHIDFLSKIEQHKMFKLSSQKCYLGYTGGKDSSLTLDLIEEDFHELTLFKINFDDEPFNNDYKISYKIHNNKLYEEFSSRHLFQTRNLDYYQEEDIHAVFAAPYFSVKEGDPAFLALGIPWDNLNSYVFNEQTGKRISEYVLAETQDSLQSFIRLMRFYGLEEFEIFSPLATLNSFAIYNIIRKKFGAKKLQAMISCWNPNTDGSPCGNCMKCLRVNYIYEVLNIPINEDHAKSNDPKALDYLFGSISIMKLLQQNYYQENFQLENSILIDPEIVHFDKGYHKKIATKYKLNIYNNPFMMERKSDNKL